MRESIMKNRPVIYLVPILLMLILSVLLMGMQRYSLPKLAFIDNAELFNEFDGTQELKLKIDQQMNAQQYELDSLQLILKVARNKYITDRDDDQVEQEFEAIRSRFVQRRDEVTSDQIERTQKYTGQIWAQINQYIEEFGEVEEYDFIYGATGTGSLMYAGQSLDITDEVVDFINMKYHDE